MKPRYIFELNIDVLDDLKVFGFVKTTAEFVSDILSSRTSVDQGKDDDKRNNIENGVYMIEQNIELGISLIMVLDMRIFRNSFVYFLETGDVSHEFLSTVKTTYNFFDSLLIGDKEFFLDKLDLFKSVSQTQKLVLCQSSLGMKPFINDGYQKTRREERRKGEFVVVYSATKDIQFVQK